MKKNEIVKLTKLKYAIQNPMSHNIIPEIFSLKKNFRIYVRFWSKEMRIFTVIGIRFRESIDFSTVSFCMNVNRFSWWIEVKYLVNVNIPHNIELKGINFNRMFTKTSRVTRNNVFKTLHLSFKQKSSMNYTLSIKLLSCYLYVKTWMTKNLQLVQFYQIFLTFCLVTKHDVVMKYR